MSKHDDTAPTRALLPDVAPRWTSPAPNGREIAVVLQQLAADCARDDARMMKGPWAYNDTEAEIRVGDDRTGDLVALTIEANDGETIAASRNRLPDLVHMLREAATCLDMLEWLAAQRRAHVLRMAEICVRSFHVSVEHSAESGRSHRAVVDEVVATLSAGLDAGREAIARLTHDHAHLRRQYAESRAYVATLVSEAADLGVLAQRHVDEANKADARITELEAALTEALTIAEWEASEKQGKPEHLTRLPELRGVLVVAGGRS